MAWGYGVILRLRSWNSGVDNCKRSCAYPQHTTATGDWRLATQLAISIKNGVVVLNGIMLPAVLFPATVFEMPLWTATANNLQKQFQWHQSTSTEPGRHTINPALLHTPKHAEKVGHASILIVCKDAEVKHAILYLTQLKDIYFLAW